MLTYINIKNFAIIKDLELDLQSEMTAITGETGAGKSIIIDSLELALGARRDALLVRDNAERLEVTLIFDLANLPQARKWLIEQDLDSGNECIIRRVISNEGRSKSSINGVVCTQQVLRTLSDHLLSIHGQHEHQTLLNSEYQRELLDAFGENQLLVDRVKEIYQDWSQTKKEILELENLALDHQTKVDFLTYQLEELEGIDLKPESLEELHALQKRLNNSGEFSADANVALDVLIENDESSVINNLYQVKSRLEACRNIDPKIGSIVDLVNEGIIQIEEAVSSLRQNLNDFEHNVDSQKRVEDELANIHKIARKHQVQPEGLLAVQDNLKKELAKVQGAVAKLAEVESKLVKKQEDYLQAAGELSRRRKSAATKLNQLITEKMQFLGMVGGKFAVNLIPIEKDFCMGGSEKVEFLVSANPGLPLQPLNKVASGGELSRIGLAIQVITAEKEVTPTLIFDEVDAGIGGKTADIVGKLLRKLGENAQVICITHLPQIASQSHNHILVEKSSTSETTEVNLTTLGRNERIQEIARMLGGLRVTNKTLASAEEMLRSVL